jgi:LmbE family N-acetylglucosaminyl deacetylase
MLKLGFLRRAGTDLRILCLGAHADDIEIGCGGTMLRLLAEQGRVSVDWVVFSATPTRAREARRCAGLFLEKAKSATVSIERFRDGFFPSESARIKRHFERLKRRASPDLLFAPYRGDAHQDHRLLGELAWNTFRDHLILEYEIPKYDGDLGSPGFYVPLDEPTCRDKVRFLRTAFRSQRNRKWFTEDTFWSILRLRGVESNSSTAYAEGFYCRKVVL